jgi:hypothetical protein
VVLVADEAAKSTHVGVVDGEVFGVAPTPDGTLVVGWHELPVATHQVAGAVEKEQRVVERPASRSVVGLVGAEDEVQVGVGDGLADGRDGVVVDVEAVFREVDHQIGPAGDGCAASPVGVAREVRLGEDEDVDAAVAGAFDPPAGLVESGLGVVIDRFDLCGTERKGLGGVAVA